MSQTPEHKNEGTALVLAIVLGLAGFPGIGLVYIGKLKIGLILLFADLALFIIFIGIVIASFASFNPFAGIGAGIMLYIVYVIAWFWGIFYTRSQAKYYNQYVDEHGKAPW